MRGTARGTARPETSGRGRARGAVSARLAGVALLLAGILVVVAGTTVRSPTGYDASGPRLAPVAVGGLLVLLSVLLLVRTVVRPDTEHAELVAAEAQATHWPTPAALAVALVAYALLLEPLGFIVATTLFLPGASWLLGSRALLRDAAVGLGIGVVVFVAFTQYLGVYLPAGVTPIF